MRLRLFAVVAMLSANLAAHADSLGTGVTYLNGTLTASVDGNSLSASESNGSVAQSGFSSASTSTTTGAASSSGIQFTFTQNFGPPDFSTGGSGTDSFFTSTGALYSITDPDPAFGSAGIATDLSTPIFSI